MIVNPTSIDHFFIIMPNDQNDRFQEGRPRPF
jgi:hypothetical protein